MLMDKGKVENLLMLTSGFRGGNKISFRVIYHRIIASMIFWWKTAPRLLTQQQN